MFSMKQFVNGLLLTTLLISACQPIQVPATVQGEFTTNAAHSATPRYAARGPLEVGYQMIVNGEGYQQPLEIHAWYPAIIPEGVQEEVEYPVTLKDASWMPTTPPVVHGHALRDAIFDATGGPYPLVVFSHGFSLSPAWYNTIAEHFASYGFIVLAPEHRDQWDPTFADMWKALIDRPGDMKEALDIAEKLTAPGGEWAGLIDMERVAVVGHSYGGYTALAMAGAQIDFAAYRDRCGQPAHVDLRAHFCQPIVPMEAEMAARAGLDSIPAGLWPAFGDSRVKAIIDMAGDAYFFGQAGLSKITIPMLAIGGTADTGTPYDWGSKLSYEFAASQQKSLVAFEGAEHMIFSTPCENQPLLQEHPFADYLCVDPVWDKAVALDLIHHFSTAFLLDTLKGDRGAHSLLLPDAVHFNAVDYATTLR